MNSLHTEEDFNWNFGHHIGCVFTSSSSLLHIALLFHHIIISYHHYFVISLYSAYFLFSWRCKIKVTASPLRRIRAVPSRAVFCKGSSHTVSPSCSLPSYTAALRTGNSNSLMLIERKRVKTIDQKSQVLFLISRLLLIILSFVRVLYSLWYPIF